VCVCVCARVCACVRVRACARVCMGLSIYLPPSNTLHTFTKSLEAHYEN